MGSYRQIFYQIVFSTKHRAPANVQAHEAELYQYISGIIRERSCHLYRICGIEDHLHIFSDLHPSICLADYIKAIKQGSGNWMKERGLFPKFKGWQDGYGAFTYTIKEKDTIIEYIKNQRQHHETETFESEYRRLLVENGIEFDERYLF